jgi:Rrf2 family transcriptional regulator, iron-sulfur cluster assembly transcription factor
MFVYGKMAANAIAIMSYLAAEPNQQAGSGEIAAARRISPTLAAKLLTQLAAAGLVRGQPGPGGGYALDRPAKEISLLDVASLFEQTGTPSVCPFGEGWCGTGDKCPLHDKIHSILRQHESYLQKTRLSVFARKGRTSAATERRLTALQKRFAKSGEKVTSAKVH